MWTRPLGSFILVASLALGGCSSFMQVAYNNGDFAIRLLAGEYLDLDGPQTDVLRPRIARFHQWHRRVEMPRYVSLLEDAAARVDRGLEQGDVAWAIDSVRTRYRTLVARAIDEAAPLASRLNADNFSALERKLAASNEKFAREYRIDDPARYRQARYEMIAKRYREWLGELTSEQERLLTQYVAASPAIHAEFMEERKRRQRAVVAVLKNAADAEAVAREMKSLLVTYEQHRSPAYARAADDWEVRLARLLVAMDRSLLPRQRKHLLERIAHYATEFRQIAGSGAPEEARPSAASGAPSVAAVR